MSPGLSRIAMGLAGLALAHSAAPAADLRGHGGPVRAISIAPDGDRAITASFDSTAILWSLSRGAATQVLRGHEGVVNAAVVVNEDLFATAGEDRKVLLWRAGEGAPARALAGHEGPIAALAVSPDRRLIASAAWDGTVRLWPAAGGEAKVLTGHGGNVNGVAFLSDRSVVSAAYDGVLRRFSAEGALLGSFNLGLPLNAVAVAPGDGLVVAAADGAVRFVDASGAVTARVEVSETPLVALAVSPDGRHVAAAGFRGALAILDRAEKRVLRRLEGPAFPLWSLAFSGDGTEILTGGADRMVRRWSVATGEPSSPALAPAQDDIPARLKSHPGAEVFKACVACHTLRGDDGARAGPTLAGLYGRRIATAPGYDFSPALKNMDIVWTPDTVQRLFEIGPAAYTPGTKMPEQTIARDQDRKALAEFLGLAGAPQ